MMMTGEWTSITQKKKLQAYNCRRGIFGMRGIQYWMEISVIFLDHTLRLGRKWPEGKA